MSVMMYLKQVKNLYHSNQFRLVRFQLNILDFNEQAFYPHSCLLLTNCSLWFVLLVVCLSMLVEYFFNKTVML